MGSKRFSAPQFMLNVQLAVGEDSTAERVPLDITVDAVLVTVILAVTVLSLKTVAVDCTTVGCTVELTTVVPLATTVV